MPRISAERERAVRDRILRAAMAVFAESGFHRATMQDIVRASGLSVGAIYTHFRSKSELILASCDLVVDQELGELRGRLVEVTDYRERIAVAVGFFLDGLGSGSGNARGPSALLLEAWAAADTDPAIRDMLLRRRREVVTICAMLLQEGVILGELPAWLETAEVAHALAGLLDGVILQSAEEGAAFRRSDAERRVLSVIETMLASAGASEGPRLVAVSPRASEVAGRLAATNPGVGRVVRSARPRAQRFRGPVEPDNHPSSADTRQLPVGAIAAALAATAQTRHHWSRPLNAPPASVARRSRAATIAPTTVPVIAPAEATIGSWPTAEPTARPSSSPSPRPRPSASPSASPGTGCQSSSARCVTGDGD